MANHEFFKRVFDSLANDGCIGEKAGQLAYAYIRVSSNEQSEEGRSGLPRQIEHCHQIAVQNGYKIPWNMVYADDHTGYEFADRPALSKLRKEYKSSNRRANVVIIEHLDRLSRNADWHQGFLLDEMKQHSIVTLFWKSFSSRIERAVMGAIAQDGMEQSKERMMAGNIEKAKSGRVTARTATYGFDFVDSEGNKSDKTRRETYYAINELEASTIRYIFNEIAFMGASTWAVARKLDDMKVPTPRKVSIWDAGLINYIVKNPAYKGEFTARRWKHIKVEKLSKDGLSLRTVMTKILRPENEWIIVPVPRIINPEIWNLANQNLQKNRQMSKRNGKTQFLLTGLVRCASCGYAFSGSTKITRYKDKQYVSPFYRCLTSSRRKLSRAKEIDCDQPQISQRILEDAVWSVVCLVLLDPSVLLRALDDELASEKNGQLREQIQFLETTLHEMQTEDEKLYRAYKADVFDEFEYAERRKSIKETCQKINTELTKLRAREITPQKIELQKQIVLAIAERAKQSGLVIDAPFDVKQRIIKMVIDRVTINAKDGSFELEGAVRGIFFFSSDIVNTPVGVFRARESA